MTSGVEEHADSPAPPRRIGSWQVRIIILTVAFVFLLIAVDLTPMAQRRQLYTTIITDIGVVILGLLVVDFVWQLVGGDPIQNGLAALRRKLDGSVAEAVRLPAFAAHAKGLGVRGIAAKQDPLAIPLAQRIDESRRSIDISSWALGMIREDPAVYEALLKAVERGVAVRILLPQPNALWLSNACMASKTTLVNTACRELMPDLRNLVTAGAQVRLSEKIVLMCSIIRLDDWMQVMPYLASKRSKYSPRLHLKGPDTELFKTWLAEFDHIFAEGKKALTTYHC